MKATHLLLALAVSLGAVQASAQRLPVPIVNHENVLAERAGGRAASAGDVKKAILAAAEATGRKWVVSEPAPGLLVATYHVRTHTVITEIRYADGRFSVAYRDSVNMKYAPGADGRGVIHPFYNQWVQDFVQAVRLELART
jgi:hypothetical protein